MLLHVREWAQLHREELDANWTKMKEGKPIELLPWNGWCNDVAFRGASRASRWFRIHLTFNDGVDGTVDFLQWLEGPVFEPLRESAHFRRFFLDGGTVVWANGADIAPETLYDAVRVTRSNPALRPTAPMKTKRRG